MIQVLCTVCNPLRDCVLQGPSSGLDVESHRSVKRRSHGNTGLILLKSTDNTF